MGDEVVYLPIGAPAVTIIPQIDVTPISHPAVTRVRP